MMREAIRLAVIGAVGAVGMATGAPATAEDAQITTADDAQIIELTQTPCQFVEVEEKDHGYTSTQKADCVAINGKTADERLAKSKTLNLKPGKYVFRVKNKNVPYDLGFWIRGSTLLTRATLPSTSGGGLSTGKSRDYAITLKEGEYLFSCPLNTTPDYKVVVGG